LAVYEELKKNPAFEEWIKPREHIKSLNSLLILPIQRVPSESFHILKRYSQNILLGYEMLLEGIVNNTWKHHRDYKDLYAAKEKMKSMADLLNQKKGESENREKYYPISKYYR
jgi:hypothetical protein